MKVENDFKNELLKRREVVASVTNDGPTLTRAQATKELAKKLKVDEKLLLVREIKSHFGNRDAKVYAYAYDSREALEAITPKHLLKRIKVEEEPAKEEEAPAAAEEAAPTEEAAEAPAEEASAE